MADETYRRARLHAAVQRTSVSALVTRLLDGIGAQESEFDRLLRQEQAARASMLAVGPTEGPVELCSRDGLYERKG